MIKLVFFDADGTLWNFKSGNAHLEERERILTDATLDNEVLPLLIKLRKVKVVCVVLSYQTRLEPKYARSKLEKWLKHFGIRKYFSQILVASKLHNTKDKIILKYLDEHKFSKSEALIVGDRYKWDYLAGKIAGIRSLLIRRPDNSTRGIRRVRLKNVARYFE